MNSVARWCAGGIVGLCFGALSLVAPVLAAPTAATAPAPSAGQGLEISPPLFEVSANPGQTVTINIRVRNVTSGELAVSGKADDFGAGGENGDPHILLDETEATRYSLKYWVTGVPDFDLVPQEVKTAQIQIAVPANAEPGGHYGVIRFTGTPPDIQGTGVSLSASLGALVLMKVNGAITDQLNLAEMYASTAVKAADGSLVAGRRSGFFENGPLILTERIKNTGSVHEKPDGTVAVYGMFGEKVASLPLSSPSHNVLPDSIRRFDQTLNKHWLFGHYTMKLAATYASGKKLEASAGFWVIPWRLILLLIVLMLVVYFGLRFGLRRYNRYIVEQSRRR